jgi:3-hydroxyacyl-CoA dehydrogenase
MSGPITTEVRDGILIVTSNNPPVNALGAAVRQGLAAAMDQLASDPELKAAVIRCEGRTFFAGADITEFGRPPVEPMLPAVVDKIEASPQPVVAAIHGTALGGGLEVALGCHYRVAVPSAKLGVPEVKLGLLPGAGGTQRLPRVAGIEAAAEMCATGTPVSAKRASEVGLVDKMAGEDSLLEDAFAFAKSMIGTEPRRSREMPVHGDPAFIQKFATENARRFRGFDAPAANLRCVQAAVELPFDEGFAF